MFRIALKGILGRKARLVLTSLAVIIGTAFLAGTSVFSATLNSTFNNLFTDVFQNVDAYVRSSQVIEGDFGIQERQRIPAELVDDVLTVPGVKAAVTDIQAFARIVGADGKPLGTDGQGPPTFGGVYTESLVSLWKVVDGRAPKGPNEAVVDEASFEKGKLTVGKPVKVIGQAGSREFTLVGVVSYGDVRSPGGATFALFDQPTASEFLAKPGYVDNILIAGDGSLSDAALAQKVNTALVAKIAADTTSTTKVETLTGEQITKETQDEIGSALSFFGILLSVFSFIALGVGCFVIYNVFSISAAQRQRENALLRAIGASRKQITRTMLIESFVVGIFGSLLGLVGGIGLSKGLSALLRALSIDLPSGGLVVKSNTIVQTLVVGVLVTVASAWLPARRAGKVPPLAAMRSTAIEIIETSRKRMVIGLAVIGAGIAVVSAVIAGADTKLLGVGILGVFIGTIILGPVIARPVSLFLGRPAARFRGITGSMARQNSGRNPKRTARTASPVLIGVALVTAVTALAASIKGQINDVFTEQLKGNYVVSTNNRGFGGLSPSLATDIAALPEVEAASGIGQITAKLDGKGQFLTSISPESVGEVWNFGLINVNYSQLTADTIFVSRKKSESKMLTVGKTVTVVLPDGTSHTLTVAGLYEQSEFGDYIVSKALTLGRTTAAFDIGVYIKTKAGVSETAARVALQKAVDKYGQGDLLNKQEYIDKNSGNVNQLLGLIYGLLFLSIIISIVGIIITLLLSVFERQRELGLLRAVGMTRSQVRTTVRWESIITSLLGAAMGITLGIGLGWVIVFALRDQGLTTFSLPVSSTIVIVILSFFVGVLAAVYPAWRATKVDILSALNTN
jgi:putative ABC transport system permease protein